MRDCNEDECIQSVKACYEAAIRSEAKENKNKQRSSSMHSDEGSLLRSRHSVGSETDTASGRERTSTRERERDIETERERESERAMNEADCIQ
jgi:hypothetical protein